jgi:hypothetical protein
VTAAAKVIDAQTDTSTGTKSRAIGQIKRALEEEYGPGVVPVPSRTTFYRLLEVLSVGKHTFGSAVTRRQTANRPEGAFTATIASRPGEQVQMDGTLLDVMAVMDDGVVDRPELVAAVDVATRTICAAVLRPVGAKAVDAALLLARMMVPEPMRPGWDQALAMSASRIPHARLVDIDTRLQLAAAKPVIIPDTVVIDHGKVFLSEVFLRAGDTLGISVQPAREQTGSDKAIMERTFESINTLFCQHVACYTGRDVTRRGRDVDQVDERAVWSLADLQELLDEWVIAGWQSRPHEGLRHPFTPDQPASPNDAYAALVAAAGYIPVALSGEDYIELLPVKWRAISEGGVQVDYRTYTCPELRTYSQYPSPIAAKGTSGRFTTTPTTLPGSGSVTTTRAAGSWPRGGTCRWWPSRSPTSHGGMPERSPLGAGSMTPTRPPWRSCWPPCCSGPDKAPIQQSRPWPASALPGRSATTCLLTCCPRSRAAPNPTARSRRWPARYPQRTSQNRWPSPSPR